MGTLFLKTPTLNLIFFVSLILLPINSVNAQSGKGGGGNPCSKCVEGETCDIVGYNQANCLLQIEKKCTDHKDCLILSTDYYKCILSKCYVGKDAYAKWKTDSASSCDLTIGTVCYKSIGMIDSETECKKKVPLSIGQPSKYDDKTHTCYLEKSAYAKYLEKKDDWIQIYNEIKPPTLAINIPGLDFSSISTTLDSEGYIYIPYLGQYLTAVYKFAIVAVSIVAVIMLIVIGAGAIVTGGGDKKVEGYKKIGKVFLGLAIAWGSYAILYNINPDLVEFKALKVRYIVPEAMPEFEGSGNYQFTGEYKSNKEYEEMANKVAEKYGFNGCLFATQLSKESGWNPAAQNSCCFGLGQVSWKNAKGLLDKSSTRNDIIKKHSTGCPLCPQANSTKEQIAYWLVNDPEGNLIVAGKIRTWALKGPNPVASASIYGMGSGSYNLYLKVTGCKAEKFTEEQLLQKLKSGVSIEELIKASCIPPDTWALPSVNSGCPGGSYLCCVQSVDINKTCKQPGFSDKGRFGVCYDGSRKGLTCAAVAGAETYIKSYIKNIQRCVK